MQRSENNVNIAVTMYVCGFGQLPMTLCEQSKAMQSVATEWQFICSLKDNLFGGEMVIKPWCIRCYLRSAGSAIFTRFQTHFRQIKHAAQFSWQLQNFYRQFGRIEEFSCGSRRNHWTHKFTLTTNSVFLDGYDEDARPNVIQMSDLWCDHAPESLYVMELMAKECQRFKKKMANIVGPFYMANLMPPTNEVARAYSKPTMMRPLFSLGINMPSLKKIINYSSEFI